MRILITGANGFLGSHLAHFFSQKKVDVYTTGRGPYRDKHREKNVEYNAAELTSKKNIHGLIQSILPDVIIHTAAMSKPNDCHIYREECLQINVEATRYLLEAATSIAPQKKVHFIFLSTDFIFGENGPHAEDDIPNPLNFYGESKLMAEKIVSAGEIPYTIVRPVFVYGPVWEGTRGGFIQLIKNSLENNQPVKVVTDEERTPTFVGDFCKGIFAIIERSKTGIFHLAGKEILSPADMAIATAALLGLRTELLEKVKGEDLKQAVVRPRRSGLKIERAINELDFNPVFFEEGLRESFSIR
ncbi:MAG: SDR family oxidoreductase [Chitinophagaceae bacterium]